MKSQEPAEPAHPAAGGEVLFGRYQVVREIGRGGMGVVLLAMDRELNTEVAVKMVPDLIVRDREGLDELKREVLRGMALTHPNIVRTHGFERDDMMAGIIMEYVEGGNFVDLKHAHAGGCMDSEKLLPWLEQLCPVLDYAHFDIRIAHRDLKPQNLMYSNSGRLKIADFGISSTLNDTVTRVTMLNASSGTPAYMSPQQIMGERVSHLDDIYALGATIFEMMTSKPPFYKGQVLAQVLDCQPPTMESRREELGITGKAKIPHQWEEVVAACLSKEPSRRPQSAGEVLELLRMPSSAALSSAPSASPVVKKNRARAVAWLAAVVAVLVTAGFMFLKSQKAPVLPVTSQNDPNRVVPGPIETAPEPPVIDSPNELPTARVGEFYQYSLAATSGKPPYVWSTETTALPRGIGLEAGLLAGTPVTEGKMEFEVKVMGSDGGFAHKSFVLAILPKTQPPPKPDPLPVTQAKVAAVIVPDPVVPEQVVPMINADKDHPYVNSLGMKFVPAGTPDVLFSIWLSRVQDFRAYVTSSGYDATKNTYSVEIGGRYGFFNRGDNWEKPGKDFGQADDFPVCGVSWNDAVSFCKWLTDKEWRSGELNKNFEYRLPTDSEWIASLGIKNPGKVTFYPWGTTWPPPEGRGNLAGQELRDGGVTPPSWPKLEIRDNIPRTSRVDRFPANSFGIHDFFGNLWQFCEDASEQDSSRHLLRGGSWGTSDKDELKLNRGSAKVRPADGRAVDAGFRCVLARIRKEKP